MPGNSKQMPGKGTEIQIHMIFTVPVLCITFLVCQVGGGLKNDYAENWLHEDGQSHNSGPSDSAHCGELGALVS